MTYVPTSAASVSTYLTVTNNASGSPHYVSLTGNATATPAANLSAAGGAYGAQLRGASSSAKL